MSILTKISIVILLLLVLLACPVFITQATIQPTYKLAYEKEYQRRQASDQNAAQANFAADRAKHQMDTEVALANQQLENAKGDTKKAQDQLATLRADYVKLQNDLQAIRADLTTLRTDYETVEKRLVTVTKNRDGVLKKNGELLDEVRELQASLKDALASGARLEKVVRVLREEIAARDDQIRDLSEKLRLAQTQGGGPAKPAAMAEITGAAGTAEAPHGFEADVIAVNNDVASINAGSRKGLKSGMKLIVFRDSKFVAYLRVAEVDTNEAVGIITDRKLDPVTGDKVMSR